MYYCMFESMQLAAGNGNIRADLRCTAYMQHAALRCAVRPHGQALHFGSFAADLRHHFSLCQRRQLFIGFLGNKIALDTFLSDFPTFTLTKFEPLTMAIITLIIMFIAFVAGTLPARRAAKKNPIDALRYE